ncbi:MAG: DUF4199 domain-containing protein [Bacteroidales bacterium]|nr:DUF4199 domain-containing protein [Bacteroidales bacterium]
MEQSNKWSSAAMDGLYLSLVTIIYSLVVAVMMPESFIIKTLLWVIKFGGCLYLLWFFMKRWSDQFDTITYSQSYNYGFIICLLSSVMCACYSYIQVEWLFPEQTEQAITLAKETMAQQGTLDSNTENIMDSFFGNFGRISMFVSLFYYIIFGSIASAITANFTKKTNPFVGTEE